MISSENLQSVVGIITNMITILYSKDGKGVLNVHYTGRYHAPIFLFYKEGKPCKAEDVVGLPVIIKWGKDLDKKGIQRTYMFVHHWPNIQADKKIRMLLVEEKDVAAGAWIKYAPTAPILDETFYSKGGTHWQRFLLTEESEVKGVRVTATQNNHNRYEIAA